MGMLGDLLAKVDAGKRTAGKRLEDLFADPLWYMQQAGDVWAENWKQLAQDPLAHLGPGGMGRLKVELPGGKMLNAPNQADLAGRLFSLGNVGPQGARQIYNMRGAGGGAVDPELLRLIEEEAGRKGRGLGL